MAKKAQPLGICDLCRGKIPPNRWYTSQGQPRQHCSRTCRNPAGGLCSTANSRAGADIRSQKARQRVARGEWNNPAKLNPPSSAEQARRARLGRKREVAEGRWRNLALSKEAREKLSRPRKHGDDSVLHSAIEKLRQGAKVADLTAEEAEAHRAYRRKLRAARRDEINAAARRRYHEQQAQMSEEARAAQRAKWRAANRRRKQRKEKASVDHSEYEPGGF